MVATNVNVKLAHQSHVQWLVKTGLERTPMDVICASAATAQKQLAEWHASTDSRKMLTDVKYASVKRVQRLCA